jgi:hypothetical protein
LFFSGNTALWGLVSFGTGAEIRKELTDNREELFDVIDSYGIGDRTCVACGIERGTELLKEGCAPVRAMILMTNGRANWCTYGVCEPEMAKYQAVKKAEEAWLNYGISVYTIPYADSTDTTTLEQIANVSQWKFYDYGTPMEDVYQDIIDGFSSAPSDVSLDVGSDGSEEFSHPGEFLGTERVDFALSLDDLADCGCEGCEEDCGVCPPGGEESVFTPSAEGAAGGQGLLGMFTAGQIAGGGLLVLLLIGLLIVLFFMKRKKK